MLTPKFIALALILSATAGLFSMHGLGGGPLYTPIQVLFGVEFHQAATTSQLLIIIASLSSMVVFGRANKVDWPLALVLESAAVLGGFLGGFFAYQYSARTMLTVLAAVVFLAAFSMRSDYRRAPPSRSTNSLWSWKRESKGVSYGVNLVLGLPLWFLIGVVSGLTGIAGGLLKVPAMVLLFGMPLDVAFGCSTFMISMTAGGGLLGHLMGGELQWRSALALGGFVAVGAQIGPRLTLRANPEMLRRRFSYLLFLIAIATLAFGWLR